MTTPQLANLISLLQQYPAVGIIWCEIRDNLYYNFASWKSESKIFPTSKKVCYVGMIDDFEVWTGFLWFGVVH